MRHAKWAMKSALPECTGSTTTRQCGVQWSLNTKIQFTTSDNICRGKNTKDAGSRQPLAHEGSASFGLQQCSLKLSPIVFPIMPVVFSAFFCLNQPCALLSGIGFIRATAFIYAAGAPQVYVQIGLFFFFCVCACWTFIECIRTA